GTTMLRLLLAAVLACIALAPARGADPAPKRVEWTVGDAKREALVYVPEAAAKAESPVVFVFHGHGGTMRGVAERSFALHKHWPGAVCVYPQGLLTPGVLTDPEGKRPGWQHNAGDHG